MAHLFRHGSTKELEQDFEVFGAPPPELLAEIQGADEFELWPENVEPLNLFIRLQTQWRIGMNGPTGLDYAGVRAALAMLGRKSSPDLFTDLQAMEAAALKTLRAENK